MSKKYWINIALILIVMLTIFMNLVKGIEFDAIVYVLVILCELEIVMLKLEAQVKEGEANDRDTRIH